MKKFLAAVMAAVMLLSLAACGQKPAASDGENEKVKITIWFSSDAMAVKEEAVAQFNAAHDDIEVVASFQSTDGLKDALKVAASSDTMPTCWRTYGGSIGGYYVDNDLCYDLTDYAAANGWDSHFTSSALNLCRYDGKLFGYPNSYNVISMWYSKPIFEQNGIEIPTTFEEFEAACDKLAANGVTPISTAALYGWHTMRLVELLVEYYAGAELHDQLNAMQASWDCPEVIQALTKYQEWSQKGYFPEGFLTADPDTTRYSVFSGKAAMDIDGQWFDSYIIDDGMNMDDFGTLAFPEARLSSFVEMFQFDKNISEAELKAVMEFLDFYMGDEFVNEHSSGYNMPLPVQGSKAPADQVHIDGIFAVSDEVGSFTVTDEALPSEVIDTLFNAQSAIANNEMTPAEGAAAIQTSIEAYQAS